VLAQVLVELLGQLDLLDPRRILVGNPQVELVGELGVTDAKRPGFRVLELQGEAGAAQPHALLLDRADGTVLAARRLDAEALHPVAHRRAEVDAASPRPVAVQVQHDEAGAGAERDTDPRTPAGRRVDDGSRLDHHVEPAVRALPRLVVHRRAGMRQAGLTKTSMQKADVLKADLGQDAVGADKLALAGNANRPRKLPVLPHHRQAGVEAEQLQLGMDRPALVVRNNQPVFLNHSHHPDRATPRTRLEHIITTSCVYFNCRIPDLRIIGDINSLPSPPMSRIMRMMPARQRHHAILSRIHYSRPRPSRRTGVIHA